MSTVLPTDEMIQAFETAAGRAVGRDSLAGIAAVRSIVERNLRADIKEWSDIAYEMWALVCNSTNGGHCTSDEWYACRDRLRDRFHAALDTLPADAARLAAEPKETP